MPLTVPVLRALEARRGERTDGPLVLRPLTGKPVDRRNVYRMVLRIAKVAGIPRRESPHSLRRAAIANALDADVPLRDAQILACHADACTTEHYDRARGNLDRDRVSCSIVTRLLVSWCPLPLPPGTTNRDWRATARTHLSTRRRLYSGRAARGTPQVLALSPAPSALGALSRPTPRPTRSPIRRA